MVTSAASNRVERQAQFDPSGQYRYFLTRTWPSDPSSIPGAIAFIMLNPSTADHQQDDPTIRRCMGFAQAWGYTTLQVVNLFALRTPHPRQLAQACQPVGADNDRHLIETVAAAQRVVWAWGNWGCLHGRDRAVSAQLEPYWAKCFCFGWTQAHQPRHPLYLKRTATLQPV